MSAYGYTRVSTAEQATEGISLEAQANMIAAAATTYGTGEIIKVFVDAAVSGGRKMIDRPAGAEMLGQLKNGDTVIATKLDRMFRNATDAVNTLEDFTRRKIRLILMDLGGDVTGNGVAALVFTIMSGVAQFERSRTAERIQDAYLPPKARPAIIAIASTGSILAYPARAMRRLTPSTIRIIA